MYWEYERSLEKQWKDYDIYLTYNEDWRELIPVVKRVQVDLWSLQLPHPDSMIANALRNAVAELDMKLMWIWTVEGIQLINKYRKDGVQQS